MLYNSATAMKPKITDFVNCDVTINQCCDVALICCLSVNWNTILNNEPLVYSTGWGANQPGSEQDRRQTSQGVNRQKAIIPLIC